MVKKQVQEILNKMKGHQVNRIYYIGSGESLAPAYAVEYIADREAEDIAIKIYDTSEFLFRKPAALGEKSVVILCSSDDPKTLKAARFATEKRAITIGLSANKETLLRKEVSYFLRHDSQEVDSLINSLYSSLYLLTTGILQEREQNAYHDLYQGMIRNLDNIDIVLNKAKNYFKPIVDRFVETATWKRVFAISGGTNYSQVFYLATSKRIKEENIDVKAIHAGELANQQFNNIDKDHVMLFYIGLDSTRPVEEEALSSVDKIRNHVFVLDAQDIDFTGIDRPFAKVFSPLIFSKVAKMFTNI